MRILYNSTNHDVVCTDQDVEYTNHDVVYIFHGDNLEIDEIVIIFVYSKKNVFYLKIRTIVLITIVDYPLDLRAGHKKRVNEHLPQTTTYLLYQVKKDAIIV